MTSIYEIVKCQKALFRKDPARLDMLALSFPDAVQTISIRVHRNHGFELLQRPMEAYLRYAGLQAEWQIGDYDDSLSFAGLVGGKADLELIWLDFDRYANKADFPHWLKSRIDALRDKTQAPIVVTNWPEADEANVALASWGESLPGLTIADLAGIARDLGPAFFDRRLSKLTGSLLSEAAHIAVSKLLGSRLLPGLVLPGIKAIAVDLDHTLYSGVLGEDGVNGVTLFPEHVAVQTTLAELAAKGVLLVCVSRNEPADVEALFRARTDFPLKASAFADWQVSWDSKAASLISAAKRLRIGIDSFLFVDDNTGELAVVAQELPMVRSVWAGEPDLTQRTLESYPCLWRSRRTNETDGIRVADIQANAQREELRAKTGGIKEYLTSLQICFDMAINPLNQVARLSELSLKTNQFNTSLRRMSEVEVAARMKSPDCAVIAVSMQDNLSDSGNVAAIFGRKDGDTLVVDEICISCRALGRNIEDIIISQAVQKMLDHFGLAKLNFTYRRGPRNTPALAWLKRYVPACGVEEDFGEVNATLDAKDWWRACGIQIVWSANE